MPRGLLVICDACRKTAVFGGDLKAARRAAVKDGWTHDRAKDEIDRLWQCPKCSAIAVAEELKRVRASDDVRD